MAVSLPEEVELPSVADVLLVLVKLLVPVEVPTMVELCAVLMVETTVEMVELPTAWVAVPDAWAVLLADAVEGWVLVTLPDPPGVRLTLLIAVPPHISTAST